MAPSHTCYCNCVQLSCNFAPNSKKKITSVRHPSQTPFSPPTLHSNKARQTATAQLISAAISRHAAVSAGNTAVHGGEPGTGRHASGQLRVRTFVLETAAARPRFGIVNLRRTRIAAHNVPSQSLSRLPGSTQDCELRPDIPGDCDPVGSACPRPASGRAALGVRIASVFFVRFGGTSPV
jgi:hypothetical protein